MFYVPVVARVVLVTCRLTFPLEQLPGGQPLWLPEFVCDYVDYAAAVFSSRVNSKRRADKAALIG